MILLDTNVVSESWRKRPDGRTIAWLDAQPPGSLYLCAPVLAELRYGVDRLEPGRRKDLLSASIAQLESDLYRDRIFPFDIAAAMEFGRLTAKRERLGRRIEPMDACIAAIAVTHDFSLATRDPGDFADLGLELINPFELSGLAANVTP